MNIEEFSTEFDVSLNSYALVTQMGQTNYPISLEFDEYEKSLFLTKAQELYVINLYNGDKEDAFETSEEYRRYLSELIVSAKLNTPQDYNNKYSKKSTIFQLPDDILFITLEQGIISEDNNDCLDGKSLQIIPTRQDELHRVMKNPFRRPNKNKILRLDLGGNLIELVSEYKIKEYWLRYLKKPEPIILEDLPETLKINNKNEAQECLLNPILHRPILETAINLAFNSRLKTAKINSQSAD